MATTRTIIAEQDRQQRQVQPGEHGGVPCREGREHRPARGDQPHLVAVPDRADGVQHGAAVLLRRHPLATPAERRHQHADAEVEALQHEEAEEQHRDEDEPEFLQVPCVGPPGSVRERQRRDARRRRAGRAAPVRSRAPVVPRRRSGAAGRTRSPRAPHRSRVKVTSEVTTTAAV